MRRFVVGWVALVAVVALLAGTWPGMPATAQEPTPQPGQAAAKRLPAASVLGQGWVALQTVSPDVLVGSSFKMSPDVFREGAARTYGGPDGARVLVVTLFLTENRVAVRRSWEDAGKLIDHMDYRTQTSYHRQEDLASMAPPPGCAEAKRLEGTEEMYLMPVGVTLCAIDPDIVAFVAVSGTLDGKTGIEASDALAQRVAQSPGTPAS